MAKSSKRSAQGRQLPPRSLPQQQAPRTFIDFLEAFYHGWVIPYWQYSILLVCIVLGTVIGVRAFDSHRQASQAKAFQALSEAEDIDALKGVAQDYPTKIAGVEAQLRVAHKLYTQGKYAEAADQFASVAAKPQIDPDLAKAARMGQAYSLEAEGKYQDAEKHFAALANSQDGAGTVVDAYLSAGRCATAQKTFAEAEKWFKRAADAAKGDSTLEQLAKEGMDGLNTARYAQAPPEAVESVATKPPVIKAGAAVSKKTQVGTTAAKSPAQTKSAPAAGKPVPAAAKTAKPTATGAK